MIIAIECFLNRSDSVQMDWDETSFKRSRAQTLQILNDTLSSLEDKDTVSSTLAREVVIVDDIMHLRSMRRQVYQIARDHEVPLLTLWINTCNDTARARNSQRPEGKHRVVEEAFEKIVRDFQPPNIEHIGDRTFLEIVPSSSTDTEVIQTSFQEILKQFDVKKERMNQRPNLATSTDASALSAPNGIKLVDECIRKVSRNSTVFLFQTEWLVITLVFSRFLSVGCTDYEGVHCVFRSSAASSASVAIPLAM